MREQPRLPGEDPPGPVRRVLAVPEPGHSELIEAFLSGRSENTLRAYRRDLEDLRRYLGLPDLDALAAQLLGHGLGAANLLAHRYRTHLLGRGLASATVARRLAAVRSLVKLGKRLGLVEWTLDVEPVRVEPYRDVRGPDVDGVRRLLAAVRAPGGHRVLQSELTKGERDPFVAGHRRDHRSVPVHL